VKGDVSDLLPLFLEEAGSRLDRLVTLLSDAREDPAAAVQARRELHALKGASRMMGMSEVADLCHKAEDCMVGEGPADLGQAADLTRRVMEILDTMQAAVDEEEISGAAPSGVSM